LLDGKLEQVGTKACLYLDDPEVLGVFTLIDLYGMNRVKHSAEDSLDSKVKRVREWLKGRIGHARANDFFPHLSVHEIEAWMFAEGSALATRLADPGTKPDNGAESRNFQNPPSKPLNELFLHSRLKRSYHKITDGRPLFSKMEFDPVYKTCRYFREFYDDLTAVATR